MNKRKITIISIVFLFIIGIISGIYIYKQQEKEKRETYIYNNDIDRFIQVFCVEGTRYKNKKGKEVIKDYKIDTKKLATKIYVYKEKYGELTDLNEFFNRYIGLEEKASGLYIKIYIDNIEDFSPEYQKELEQKQTEIEKIEEWLKNGQIQKLEEWLSKQEF